MKSYLTYFLRGGNKKMLQWIITMSLLGFAFEFFINYRQYKYLNIFPREIKEYFNEEEYTKNRNYKQALVQLHLFELICCTIFDIYLFTKYNEIYNFIQFQSNFLQAIAFLCATFFLHYTMKLPFDYFKHFRIEQMYEFNKMTIGLYLKDKAKWSVMFVVLISIFLGILNLVIDINIFVIWLSIVAFQVFILYLGPYIMALFNEFSLCKDDLKDKISHMCEKVNYPLGGVYTMDQGQRSSHSNAFMYGLFKKYIVLFDTLLSQLNDSEIVAVLNHELGHWYYSHVTKLVVHQCLWILLFCVGYPLFVGYSDSSLKCLENKLVAFVIYFQFLGPIANLMQISQHAITRVFEYQADKFAFEHGYGLELSSALDKLMRKNLGVYSEWLYALTKESHPRVLERLFVLKALMSESKKTK
eukprot:NODE_55_length_29507_cov_0.809712.p7 type:complete len:414 gc:universal NODE_55_length_29507_cov_0.809712:17886-19127(+)